MLRVTELKGTQSRNYFLHPNSGKGSLLGFWLLQEKVQMQREINLNTHGCLQVCCSRFGWVALLRWEVLCNC